MYTLFLTHLFPINHRQSCLRYRKVTRWEIYKMTTTFIKNEQLNFINKQINLIKDSRKRNVPAHILSAVYDLAQATILELFPDLTTEQQLLLDVRSEERRVGKECRTGM